MPTFTLSTNLSREAVPPSLAEELTGLLARELGKPKQYIAVHIIPDQNMTFGGSADPCALASLSSIGKIGDTQNKTYSKVLFELINKHLHISLDRMYINFHNLDPAYVGWNGKTFA
uniref:Macrophage migration inhibitory factor n=2 Tax=Callorhinchus milii TaxID=7868 RepID=K4GCP8_CALMI|nr:macrophage migration inhibitory factor [Callorhinchus milii]AFM86345.1 Macrophage migration inhibitory factor [Callorhinchus milii]AFM87519.1 Macrophage migration inhibitory factor [Callorhinchus milii]AFM90501.1 Macrophage migration inhibitory factor [Callorhinchus milii]|eukprot:gi/632985655/ref/XP_007909804.1/ PREDICTED: macrophage migration inhibitory factor [Callorhinchus milii]